jgi:hypothetical protein
MSDGGGCTSCKNKGGCETHKGDMFAAIDDALARLYPTRRWGERDEEAALRGGVPRAEAVHLAELLAPRLKAMALFHPGAADDPCDYVYVLCVGRTPSIVEIREGAATGEGAREVVDQAEGDGPLDEVYLRVALSGLVRFAAVQEVTMRMVRAPGGDLVITESPRTGVFNPILLRRFQSLVAVLTELDIRHIDFGEILEPPPGYDPADYATHFTGTPTVANYLFYPHPCTAITTTVLEGPFQDQVTLSRRAGEDRGEGQPP